MMRTLCRLAVTALALLLAAPAAAQKVTGRILPPDGGKAVAWDKVQVELTSLTPGFRQVVLRLQGEPEAPLARTRPRPDGSFEIAAPEPGLYAVTVRAEAFEPQRSELRPLLDDTELPPFVLNPAEPDEARGAETIRRVELEVRDARGRIVAGALVRLARLPIPLGLTGPDGRLSLPLAEDLELVVETEDGRSASLRLAADTQGTRVVALEPPVTVEGRVLETVSRSPVAGALVWADHSLSSLRPARTAADGSFRIQVPELRSLPWLDAAAPGHRQERGGRAGSGTDGMPEPVTLLLSPIGGFAGQVVDAAGMPIPDAEIQAEPAQLRAHDEADLLARSGVDGSFRFSRLTAGVTHEVTARKEGFAPGSAHGVAAAPGGPSTPVRIALSPGGTAFGRLTDEDGKPVAGAEVEALPLLEPDLPEKKVLARLVSATSRTDGSFELHSLSAGSFRLQAVAPGFAPAAVSGFHIPAAGRRVDLGVLTLSPEAFVEGQVIDPRGAPVAGARVEAVLETGPRMETDLLAARHLQGSSVPGPDGRFRIGGLSPGTTLRVRATAQDYTEAVAHGVEVPSPVPLRLELRPLGRVSGRVVDPEGRPVFPAHVLASPFVNGGSVHTDLQGGFQIKVQPGPVELTFSARNYLHEIWRGEVPEGGEAGPVEITLERGAILEGRVLDSGGQPVDGAHVSVRQGKSGTGRAINTGSDDDGRFSLQLETGPYLVVAQAADWGADVARASIEIQPGINRLDLRLEGGGVEVRGSVRDAAGAPLARAEVTLSSPDGGHKTVSAVDGAFRFRSVRDGAYELRAFKRGLGAAGQDVEVAGQPLQGLDLRLAPGGAITGRLLGLRPTDLAGVRILASSGSRYDDGVVLQDATYRVHDLSPGDWKVEAALASGRQVTGKVKLEPGAPEAILDLDLGGDLTLSGMVRADGVPVSLAGVSLFSSPAFEGAGGVVTTGSDGGFWMTRLTPGTYTLRIDYGRELNGLWVERRVELTADQEVSAEVVTVRVQGQVVSPDGAPVALARLFLMGTHGEWSVHSSVHTDGQGRFELRLPAGEYKVMASSEAFNGEAGVKVPAGVSNIQVQLQPASR